MISIIDPRELSNVLRPTVYSPSVGVGSEARPRESGAPERQASDRTQPAVARDGTAMERSFQGATPVNYGVRVK
jgi:hypothetical protein